MKSYILLSQPSAARYRIMSLRGEAERYKPFVITKQLTKDGRRMIIHKKSGMSMGEYKKAIKIHEKMWEEVMDELEEKSTCFVCERVVLDETNCDWCESCREKEIWRCEYCQRIIDDEEYDNTYIGGEHNAICKKCKCKYDFNKIEMILSS